MHTYSIYGERSRAQRAILHCLKSLKLPRLSFIVGICWCCWVLFDCFGLPFVVFSLFSHSLYLSLSLSHTHTHSFFAAELPFFNGSIFNLHVQYTHGRSIVWLHPNLLSFHITTSMPPTISPIPTRVRIGCFNACCFCFGWWLCRFRLTSQQGG